MNLKKKKKFYDKNGTLIKLGDKLKLPHKIKIFYKDCTVIERDGLLGLVFVCEKHFIPFNTQTEDFFKNCEIVKTNI